jgi:hypothetical protein
MTIFPALTLGSGMIAIVLSVATANERFLFG